MHDDTPRGPDEVRVALNEAAARLFAARGPAAVGIREIAAAAGVNHGLIHRYFGSKEGLLGAVLTHLAEQVAVEVERDVDLATRYGPDTAADRYWRVLAWTILNGGDPAELQSRFPTIDAVITLGTRDLGLTEQEARRRAAHLAALELGWRMFEPFLIAAAGLGDDPPSVVRGSLQAAGIRLITGS